jgi:hypothetical protein
MEQPLADDHPQNRVAEELHPLVRGQPVLHPGGVGHRGLQELGVAEGVADAGLAAFKIAAQTAGVRQRISAHRNVAIAEASLMQRWRSRGATGCSGRALAGVRRLVRFSTDAWREINQKRWS